MTSLIRKSINYTELFFQNAKKVLPYQTRSIYLWDTSKCVPVACPGFDSENLEEIGRMSLTQSLRWVQLHNMTNTIVNLRCERVFDLGKEAQS